MNRPTNVFLPEYYQLLTIWDAQQRAAADNLMAQTNWPGITDNWVRNAQQEIAYGRVPPPAPQPPLMTVVSDAGVVSHVSFRDLSAPVLPNPAITPSTGGFTFGGAPGSAVAPDRTDQIILMLRAIAAKLGIGG